MNRLVEVIRKIDPVNVAATGAICGFLAFLAYCETESLWSDIENARPWISAETRNEIVRRSFVGLYPGREIRSSCSGPEPAVLGSRDRLFTCRVAPEGLGLLIRARCSTARRWCWIEENPGGKS